MKENTSLPVLVTMSFEQTGRTFTGCTIPSMARTLEGLGADAVGLNCSLGEVPQQPPRMVAPASRQRTRAAANSSGPMPYSPVAGSGRPALGLAMTGRAPGHPVL